MEGDKAADDMVKKAEETLKTGKLKSMKGPSLKTGMLFDVPTNSEKVTKAIDLYLV